MRAILVGILVTLASFSLPERDAHASCGCGPERTAEERCEERPRCDDDSGVCAPNCCEFCALPGEDCSLCPVGADAGAVTPVPESSSSSGCSARPASAADRDGVRVALLLVVALGVHAIARRRGRVRDA